MSNEALTDEEINDALTRAVKAGELSWLGYKKDEDGKYTLPVLSKADFQAARIIESAVLAKLAEGVELPEPVAWQWLDTSAFRKKIPPTGEAECWNPIFTADQLRQAIAADRAKREGQKPLGYLSEKQLVRITDPEDASGVYIPMRKTSAGNFTFPIYTHPAQAQQEDSVRYCYECGSIGEVPDGKRDCCPDGSHARYVHQIIAEQAQGGFHAVLNSMESAAQQVNEQLLEAAEKAADWMEGLRASGDAGNWDWSEGGEYLQLRAAIAAAQARQGGG